METIRTYHNNGQIESECNYINCILDGLCKAWYKNGQIESECNYINGMLDGLCKVWYKNGQLMSEGKYINGKTVGLWKTWFGTGQLYSEGNYINGKREGLWKTWFENGQLYFEGNYINGKRDGLWKIWDRDGAITETLYNNGVTVTYIPIYNTVQKHTDEECLIYKSKFDLGRKYLMCSNKEEHVMDYEFIIGFGRTEELKNIKCVYCSHKVNEGIYEQV